MTVEPFETEEPYKRFAELADRLERMVKDAAPILGASTITSQQIDALSGRSEALRLAFRLLAIIEPVVQFMETAVVPELQAPSDKKRKRGSNGRFSKPS
jgi:hypothetical protein